MNKETEQELNDAVEVYRVALNNFINASKAEDAAKLAKDRARSALASARGDLRAKEQDLLSL